MLISPSSPIGKKPLCFLRATLSLSLLAVLAVGLPVPGFAQAADAPAARPAAAAPATGAQNPTAADDTEAPKKRGISEEGGMAASGPSQGKGGESR